MERRSRFLGVIGELVILFFVFAYFYTHLSCFVLALSLR